MSFCPAIPLHLNLPSGIQTEGLGTARSTQVRAALRQSELDNKNPFMALTEIAATLFPHGTNGMRNFESVTREKVAQNSEALTGILAQIVPVAPKSAFSVAWETHKGNQGLNITIDIKNPPVRSFA